MILLVLAMSAVITAATLFMVTAIIVGAAHEDAETKRVEREDRP